MFAKLIVSILLHGAKVKAKFRHWAYVYGLNNEKLKQEDDVSRILSWRGEKGGKKRKKVLSKSGGNPIKGVLP